MKKTVTEAPALPDAPAAGDIPEAPALGWREARRLYKPRKEAISLRLDADVLDWLRRSSRRYQSEINRLLRERMEAASAPAQRSSSP